jgi:glutathione S-transferase
MLSGVAMRLTYFPLWARGPASALALEHGGLRWEGRFPGTGGAPAWQSMKETAPWGHLPLLEVEGGPIIGHELAILTYLGRQSAALGGATEAEWALSQQLLSESDDIYAKLTTYQPTTREADKGWSAEQMDALWTSSDAAVHNRLQSIPVHLQRLEAVCAAATPGLSDGFLTSSGTSVGECKLWATLHKLRMIKGVELLEPYSTLRGFYDRFSAEEKTVGVVEHGGRFPGKLAQYFV